MLLFSFMITKPFDVVGSTVPSLADSGPRPPTLIYRTREWDESSIISCFCSNKLCNNIQKIYICMQSLFNAADIYIVLGRCKEMLQIYILTT